MDDQNPNCSFSKPDRKTIEKNRRNQMKDLYSNLTSLVPRQSPREAVSLPDKLEGAANYIKKLQNDLEKMKQKKNCLLMGTIVPANNNSTNCTNKLSSSTTSNDNGGSSILDLPNIDVRITGSALEVVVITGGQNSHFMFSEIIRMLHEEEGAEVVNAGFSVLNGSVFHTLHCKIGESLVQDHDAAARISERLRKFVYDVN